MDAEAIARTLANYLKCGGEPSDSEDLIKKQKRVDACGTKVKKAMAELNARKLKGKEKEDAYENEVAPLAKELAEARRAWLEELKRAVPSTEIALGKHLNATGQEFRAIAQDALAGASASDRRVPDLLAAFGSDACLDEKTRQIRPTPFCFITGSGHQYFLDTVRKLWAKVNERRLQAALFEPWDHRDEKLSMRWDPVEDRRYALMWEDPTSAGNEARTTWAANLLAYLGLQLLPSVPTASGLETTGFVRATSAGAPRLYWAWPIWEQALGADVVRSLLACPLLSAADGRMVAAMGISQIFRAERIQVGDPPLFKINFTPTMAAF